MKYTYKISGLDCPKCAKKIEDTLNRHQDFKNVVVNFATLKITYETDIKNSLSVINKIIKEIDANVKIVETEENKVTVFDSRSCNICEVEYKDIDKLKDEVYSFVLKYLLDKYNENIIEHLKLIGKLK